MKPRNTQKPVKRQEFKRRGHIVLALLAVLFLVGVVPLATMSWKLIQSNRRTLTTAQQVESQLIASSMAHRMDLQVEGIRTRLLSVAAVLGTVGDGRTVPRDEVRRILSSVTDSQVPYVRYGYFQNQAVRMVSAGEHADNLEPMFTAILQRVVENHAEQAAGGHTPETVESDPFYPGEDPRGALMVIAAPVLGKDTLRGVLTTVVDLDAIWQATTRRHRTGHVIFAADERGTTFATTKADEVAPRKDMSSSPLVKKFILSVSMSGESMPFVLNREGEEHRYIGSYEKTTQGWGIFVQARDEEIYWTVHDMERSTISWMIALFVISGLAAIVLARSLSNPINRLAAAARSLANGKLSTRVEVRSRNEVGELAHAFNSMASEIEDYVQRLKRAFKDNNELFLGTIRALAQAIDAKDPYTRGHSVRVNRYSVILARELRLSENEIRDIYVSSLLHDVGKIGIDDAILGKPGRLTDEEFEVIKTHTVLGAKIMEPIRQMEPIIPGLRYHHERCDGSGYPDGLTREQTPLMARIIAVADTFDAITTDRPYQDRMTFEVAVARINELKGQFLDAQVVAAFNNACVAGHIRLDREMETETIMIPPSQDEGDDVLANVDVIPAMPVSASDPGTGSAVE